MCVCVCVCVFVCVLYAMFTFFVCVKNIFVYLIWDKCYMFKMCTYTCSCVYLCRDNLMCRGTSDASYVPPFKINHGSVYVREKFLLLLVFATLVV